MLIKTAEDLRKRIRQKIHLLGTMRRSSYKLLNGVIYKFLYMSLFYNNTESKNFFNSQLSIIRL